VSVARRITLPDLSDDENDTLARLLYQLAGYERFNRLVDSYYDASRNMRRAHGGVVPPQYYRLGLVLGWTSKAVDALARRCNLDGLVWADGDLDSLGYRELWDGNRLASETDQGVTSSLIHATSFVVASRGEEGEPQALVHFADAADATGEWNTRTRLLDAMVWVNDRDDKGAPKALTLYLDGRTVTGWYEDGAWNSDVSEHPFPVPAAPLPYRPRLKRPFGRSRISRPVRGIQDAAARELVRLEGHMDVYSFPEFWMLGADESVFTNADGSLKAQWEIMLGRIKGIPDDMDLMNSDAPQLSRADVKKFDAASPEPHLAALNTYSKLFARETSLPDSSVAITDVANPTSAEAYDSAQYELIAEAEGATDEWSPALRYVTRIALAMQNGLSEVPPEWLTIDTRWRDPRYQSRAAMADAGSKQIAAMPGLADTEVGLELLGLDQQQIDRVIAERRRARVADTMTALASVAPPEADEDEPGEPAQPAATEEADVLKAKFDALGVAVRAGVSPEDAAARLGLAGITFTGATPVSLRQPESAADEFEER